MRIRYYVVCKFQLWRVLTCDTRCRSTSSNEVFCANPRTSHNGSNNTCMPSVRVLQLETTILICKRKLAFASVHVRSLTCAVWPPVEVHQVEANAGVARVCWTQALLRVVSGGKLVIAIEHMVLNRLHMCNFSTVFQSGTHMVLHFFLHFQKKHLRVHVLLEAVIVQGCKVMHTLSFTPGPNFGSPCPPHVVAAVFKFVLRTFYVLYMYCT